MLANIDHLFAFHMAGEDAHLLHELEGIDEADITNLDDFQCYVKLSLHGRRLPVFSLNLDVPTQPDEDLARLVRLRSQERNGRSVGVVDDLILQIQARQKSAGLTIQRASRRRGSEETGTGNTHVGEEVSSMRRHKKRGGSNRNKQQEGVVPSHVHLMYREEDESELSRKREDDVDSSCSFSRFPRLTCFSLCSTIVLQQW